MTSDWPEVALGELITLEYGKALRESERDGGRYPVFGSAGQVGSHSHHLGADGPMIVVGRKGTAGSVYWSETPGWPIDTAYWVRPRTLDVSPRFLYLLLQAADLPSVCAQTGVPGLNRERAYEIRVAVPSLDEQRRIVDLMQAVDRPLEAAWHAAVCTSTTAIALAAEIWTRGGVRVAPVRSIAEGTNPHFVDGDWIETKDQSADGNIRLLQLADIGLDQFLDKSDRWISTETFNRLHCHEILPGDLLVSRMADPIGRVCAVPDTGYRMIAAVDCCRIRLDLSREDSPYWRAVLCSPQWFEACAAVAGGSTRQRITRKNLEQVMVPHLPKTEQRAIGVTWDALRAVENKARNLHRALGSLRETLLADLLSGAHDIPGSYDCLLDGAA